MEKKEDDFCFVVHLPKNFVLIGACKFNWCFISHANVLMAMIIIILSDDIGLSSDYRTKKWLVRSFSKKYFMKNAIQNDEANATESFSGTFYSMQTTFVCFKCSVCERDSKIIKSYDWSSQSKTMSHNNWFQYESNWFYSIHTVIHLPIPSRLLLLWNTSIAKLLWICTQYIQRINFE